MLDNLALLVMFPTALTNISQVWNNSFETSHAAQLWINSGMYVSQPGLLHNVYLVVCAPDPKVTYLQINQSIILASHTWVPMPHENNHYHTSPVFWLGSQKAYHLFELASHRNNVSTLSIAESQHPTNQDLDVRERDCDSNHQRQSH